MKISILFQKVLLVFFLFFILNTSLSAREIAGVEIQEQITVEAIDDVLILNGAGIRSKFFFKIYVGALYLTQTTTKAEDILNSNKPNRVSMHMLYDEVEKEKMVDGWIEGFENNLDSKAFAAVKDRLDRFNKMFSDMHKGERVLLDYIPGKGTRVMLKGDIKGTIEGADFNRALLSVWLGEDPVTDDLKDALLGKD